MHLLKKHLLGKIQGCHKLSESIANKIISKTLKDYHEGAFFCFNDSIEAAGSEIRSASQMISMLDSGTTALGFAESLGISVVTARKRLNSSSFSSKNCDRKPYVYTLICNE